MARKRTPTKSQASKAGKTLSSSNSKAAKSAAVKTLAKKSAAVRTVHSAPKTGTVSRASVKRAVKSVSSSRKSSPKKGK